MDEKRGFESNRSERKNNQNKPQLEEEKKGDGNQTNIKGVVYETRGDYF